MKMKTQTLPFMPADILLPKNCSMPLWSVVACDQYTSQPEYWERVEQNVGEEYSTLRMVLPESHLKMSDVENRIIEINQTMTRYLQNDVFQEYPNSLIYVERSLSNGKLRRGLIGKADLEQYDYRPNFGGMIRATEGTVVERIPPRMRVRENAPLEFPHILLLMDDIECSVVEPLGKQTGEMKLLYDFELMEGGGHIQGWLLTQAHVAQVAQALEKLSDPKIFSRKYGTEEGTVMLFAVGDGNHSLATAKECYEQEKQRTKPEQWSDLRSRYALVELGNLHDESLEFEPIHRIVMGVEPEKLLSDLCERLPGAYIGEGEGYGFQYVYAGQRGAITIANPKYQLPVAALQNFLDAWMKEHTEAEVDYIHGADVAVELAEKPQTIAFLLPAMEKKELFPSVIYDGVLPRKTFSVGEARDKRFYLEGRRIQGRDKRESSGHA